MARAVTLDIASLDELVATQEGTEIHSALHVDDLAHLVIAKNELAARRTAIRLGSAFRDGVASKNLKISSKSGLVASHPRLALDLERDFKRAGLPIGAKKSVEDLVAEVAAGASRCAKTADKRREAAKTQTCRVEWLSKLSRKAKKLFATGVKPKASYDAYVAGPSPSARLQLTRLAARCAGAAGTQPCRTSLIEFSLGYQNHPQVFMMAGQVELSAILQW